MRVSYEDGRRVFVIGTGNINYSLYGTRDVWLFVSAAPSSQESSIEKDLRCQISVLVDPQWQQGVRAEQLAHEYASCASPTQTGEQSKFLAFLTPIAAGTPHVLLDQVIPQLVGSARSVFLTSQDFGGPKIRRLLEGFLAKGGRLRLLLDDDWFYVRFLGERFGMADYEFAVGWILRTQRRYPSTFEVRYLETDNTAEFQTSLHHKFIIFQGGSRDAVLFGSPNLKDGALLKNIENVYVVRDSDVVRRFVQFAEDSWSKALPDLEMPIVDSNQFR